MKCHCYFLFLLEQDKINFLRWKYLKNIALVLGRFGSTAIFHCKIKLQLIYKSAWLSLSYDKHWATEIVAHLFGL